MKTVILFCNIMIVLAHQALSNNVQVSNVRLTNQNTTDDFVMVEFDISWENSWRMSTGPANWDAAWIFVKYRVGPASPWTHAFLNNTGHETCSGMTTHSGLLTPGAAFNATTNPALGVFLYRSSNGSGNINCQQVRLRWNYAANGLADDAQMDIKVFAIEHVYIPAGPFTVGSGGTEPGALYTYPTSTNPYQITNENAITVGTTSGNLFYNNPVGLSGDQAGPIPAAYPKGTVAFYAMKYEISQFAYIEFLNTLTKAQQVNRVRSDITQGTVPNRFVMSNTSSPSFRNGVSCRSVVPYIPAPIEFGSDLSNNAVENGVVDGQNISCNWLQWSDVAAYLDWAALRPMSELEFEKCARGPATPVPNEYVWGNNTINLLTGVINNGANNELPTATHMNCTGPGFAFPVRCGMFARPGNDRALSGAGYYGCLDLGGNVWERGATIGNFQGRLFTGVHGNGMLATDGQSDVVNWPLNSTAFGAFYRGASFYTNFNENRTSDRIYAVLGVTGNESTGGRGVRTQ